MLSDAGPEAALLLLERCVADDAREPADRGGQDGVGHARTQDVAAPGEDRDRLGLLLEPAQELVAETRLAGARRPGDPDNTRMPGKGLQLP